MSLLKPVLAVTALLVAGGCADPYAPGPHPAPYPNEPAFGPRPGEVVNVLGCARQGVEAGCLAVVDGNGAPWDIGQAQPRPDPYGDFVIELSGRVSDRPSYCRQGPVLEDVQWRYTSLRCPR